MEDSSHRLQTHDREHDSSLKSAERHPAAFRFLDLPPEMRNLVYGHLLTLTPEPKSSPSSCFGSCHPGILATCRQIHNEAAGLLACSWNTEQPFKILFHADWVGTELLKTVQIQNHGVYKAKETEFEQLLSGSLAYPSYIRRVTRLHIEVSVMVDIETYRYGCPFVGSAAFARACIHTLVSFLMEGHSLQELRVRVKSTSLRRQWRRGCGILQLLPPLQRLRNIAIVDVNEVLNGSQNLPGYWAPMIEKMQTKTNSLPTNILDKMREIRHLCEAIVERDDDDDERKAEHQLLAAFYRYITWELHLEGPWTDRARPQTTISQHLAWMKLRIMKMRDRDMEAPRIQQRSYEQAQSPSRSYWEVLSEAAIEPWSECCQDGRAKRSDYTWMKAYRGSQPKALLYQQNQWLERRRCNHGHRDTEIPIQSPTRVPLPEVHLARAYLASRTLEPRSDTPS